MFMHDSTHSELAAGTALGTQNAAGLGLRWMSNTGNLSYSSPAVVNVPQLGRKLVINGNRNGFVQAFDAVTGERVWQMRIGDGVSSSPAVAGGVVYVGSSDNSMYALNVVNGARICSLNVGGIIQSSPTVWNPDGTGLRVYFGDAGVGGAPDGGHIWSMHAVDQTDRFADCSADWSYDAFGDPPGSHPEAGSWSSAGVATLSTGRKIITIGASSRDNAAYALDALTGARVWRFETRYQAADSDVGAGVTVSPPGVNGFADGMAYVIGKSHILYGLNLRTGAKVWELDMEAVAPALNPDSRSTPALVDGVLYLGWGEGVWAVDAVTGRQVWRFASRTRAPVISSPAVTGPVGQRVVTVGDVTGAVYVLDAQTGALRWTYQTGGEVFASAAITDGVIFIASSDGFLYSFGIGGATSAAPKASIAQPLDRSIVAQPAGGMLRISGTASDDAGVTEVRVAVRRNIGGDWYANGLWDKPFTLNRATLASPGARATSWTFDVPVTADGGGYLVQAEAVDAERRHTAPVALVTFEVANATGAPETTVTEPTSKQLFTMPAPSTPINVTVKGTATDTVGARKGIASVKVLVQNREHQEYFCGAVGCGGGHNSRWTTSYSLVEATLANPGAATTAWSLTFPSYDHDHSYRAAAYATDVEGNRDPTKADSGVFCVREPGPPSCNG